ncbi:MAG: DUF1583 domain-containing protein [Planctomycetaceae bacterium]
MRTDRTGMASHKSAVATVIIAALLTGMPGGISACGAQEPDAVVQASTAAGRQILEALQQDDLSQALKVLGTMADVPVPDDRRVDDGMTAAAGAIHRHLMQLDDGERFDLLKAWTLPTDDRSHVRVFTTLVPEVVPPMEFARALGERPKKDSFPVAGIGKMPGIFSSAWLLVTAAEASGNLRQLQTDLDAAVQKKVLNADFVRLLADLRDSRVTGDDLVKKLEARIEPSGTVPSPAERSDAVLVAAALHRPELGKICESIVERLNQFDLKTGTSAFVPWLRRLRAVTILQNRAPEAAPEELFGETPELWLAADAPVSHGQATGADSSVWLVHEDHVQRLAGPGQDLLFLKYPLTGDWELKAEVAEFEHGSGGLTYGGLAFDANSNRFRLEEVHRAHREDRIWPFVAPKEHRMFNRINIRSRDGKVSFLSNLHPGFTEPVTSADGAQWLGLHASGVGRIVYRNLELVGTPEIPREVKLTSGSDLRGWYGDQPLAKFIQPFPTVEAAPLNEVPGWTMTDESVTSQQPSGENTDSDAIDMTTIRYMRPLLEGDSITYEFFSKADTTIVHPTLGRVAFLVEPGGVRLRWLSADQEWTGLSADNAITEPLNRRGPRTLPLEEDAWNTMQIRLDDGKVLLALNDTEVYQRDLSDIPGSTFGLSHNRISETAKFRNVVLTGNWPEKLTPDQMSDPIARNYQP